MMKKEIYADGIGQIHFAGGMVRYDFVSMQPGNDVTPFLATDRVIMPPQGFLSMFNSMQSLIDKLVEAGVLVKNEGAAAPQAPAVEAAPTVEEGISPAFQDAPKSKEKEKPAKKGKK